MMTNDEQLSPAWRKWTMQLGMQLGNPTWVLMCWITMTLWQPQFTFDGYIPKIRYAVVLVALALILTCLRIPRLIKNARPGPLVIMIGLFAIWASCSFLYADDQRMVYVWWRNTYAPWALMFSLLWLVIQTPRRGAVMFTTIACVLASLAIFVNIRSQLEGGRLTLYYNGIGTFDGNHSGVLMVMAMVFSYGMLVSVRKIGWKIFWLGCCTVGAHGVLLSYSRTAMVALAFALAYLCFWHRPWWQSLLGGALILVVLAPFTGPEIRHRATQLMPGPENSSLNARFDKWAYTSELIKENPWIGVGMRNAGLEIHQMGYYKESAAVHNHYLQVSADFGVPAGILFLAILLLALLTAWRSRRALLNNHAAESMHIGGIQLNTRAVILTLECCVLVYMIGALMLSLESFTILWMIIALLIRMSGWLTQQQINEDEVSTASLPLTDH